MSEQDAAMIVGYLGVLLVVTAPMVAVIALVAGYAIIEVPSKAAAIEWSLRFGDVVKVDEVDVRYMPGS